MKLQNKALINRFKSFITSIKPSDRVAVIHHTDPDGVCSGVIISKVVERIRGKKIDLRLNQHPSEHAISKDTLKKFKKNKINKVITTDLACDENPESINQLSNFADVLIIDHHPILHKINSKTILIKSRMIYGPKPCCASKMCYDLGSLVTDVSGLDWLAVVGSIGDIATGPWRNWVNLVFKKHKVKLNKDLFKTDLGNVAIMISSAESVSPKNAKKCYAILYNAKSYKAVLNSNLKKFRQKIDAELDYYLKNIHKLAHIDKKLNLIYYELKSKYNVKSPLSTILGLKYPDKIVIAVDVKKNPVRISARRADGKFPVNALLIGASKGIKGAVAGGHSAASGAIIPKKDFKKFKERIFTVLNKKKKEVKING